MIWIGIYFFYKYGTIFSGPQHKRFMSTKSNRPNDQRLLRIVADATKHDGTPITPKRPFNRTRVRFGRFKNGFRVGPKSMDHNDTLKGRLSARDLMDPLASYS